MKKNFETVLAVIIMSIPLLYVAVIYKSLPPNVTTHFSLAGKPDNYGSKSEFLLIIAGVVAVNFIMYILITNLYKIDPKKTARLSKDTMQKIGLAVVVLVTAVLIIIIYATLHEGALLDNTMLLLLGLFFAYLGNLMHSVKPNYFVGLRTPWTLEDEETWRKTHRLAGKLWFAGGIVVAIGALILSPRATLILLFAVTAVITLIPVIFSYRYYQTHKHISNT